MKRTCIGGIVVVAVGIFSAWTGLAGRTQTPQASMPSAQREPSNQEVNDAFLRQISKQIAGHEQEPSGRVFKNIQVDFLKKARSGPVVGDHERGV